MYSSLRLFLDLSVSVHAFQVAWRNGLQLWRCDGTEGIFTVLYALEALKLEALEVIVNMSTSEGVETLRADIDAFAGWPHHFRELRRFWNLWELRIMSENDSQSILNTYKAMTSECQTIANKITELTSEKDEHKLVVDTLTKLEPGRKAFRLVGGVLVERTVEEVLPAVSQNFEGVSVDRLSRGTPYTDLQLIFWLLHLNLIRLRTCFKNWTKLWNRRIKTEKHLKRSMESWHKTREMQWWRGVLQIEDNRSNRPVEIEFAWGRHYYEDWYDAEEAKCLPF